MRCKENFDIKRAVIARVLALGPNKSSSHKLPKNNFMIKVTDLTKYYGDVQALKGINFSVKPGEIVGLLGPNGAALIIATVAVAGLCIWIISWEDDDEDEPELGRR